MTKELPLFLSVELSSMRGQGDNGVRVMETKSWVG